MTEKRVLGFLGATAAIVVAVGAGAAACTNLASLNLSSARGKPGDTITVTGSSFSTVCICGPQSPPTQVKIRWNGVKGEVLAEMMPEKAGTISATFTVPNAQPGYYVIAATQFDETYNINVAGTPARATFEVLTASGQSVVGGPVTPATAGTDQGVSSGLIGLTIGLGVLALALFAGGSIAVARQTAARRAAKPAVIKTD
jgi:hypothetical protein